jgi:hypothetical protein
MSESTTPRLAVATPSERARSTAARAQLERLGDSSAGRELVGLDPYRNGFSAQARPRASRR